MSRSRRYRRRALPTFLPLAAGVTIAAVTAAVLAHGGAQTFRPAADSASAGALTASYKSVSDWGTGYTGQYTIANAGSSAVSGWTLSFRLPGGTSVSSLWDGSYTVSDGKVTVTSASWDSDVARARQSPTPRPATAVTRRWQPCSSRTRACRSRSRSPCCPPA